MDNRIYRSRDTKMVAGVCGGIAEMFNLDPTLVRLVTVALVIFSGFTFLLVYVMCAIIIPLEPSSGYILQRHNQPNPEQRAYQTTTAPAAGTAEESVKEEEAAPVPVTSPESAEDSVLPEEPADYVADPVEQIDSEEEEGKY